MKTFELHRDTDVSGVSGTGHVADGVEFEPGGHCVVRWRGEHPTVTVHANMRSVEAVHTSVTEAGATLRVSRDGQIVAHMGTPPFMPYPVPASIVASIAPPLHWAPLRVVVTGGRNYAEVDTVHSVLEAIYAIRTIGTLAHGGASGADELAADWAELNGVACQRYPADWATHGRNAGPMRNAEMLRRAKPDLVIAFPGGRGTANCTAIARGRGIPVWQVEPK